MSEWDVPPGGREAPTKGTSGSGDEAQWNISCSNLVTANQHAEVKTQTSSIQEAQKLIYMSKQERL